MAIKSDRRNFTVKSSRREMKFHGLSACLELCRVRPQDIIRMYLTETRLGVFSPALRYIAKERKAYHLVGNEDLERLTETIHHQGICVLAYEHEETSFQQVLSSLRGNSARTLWVYLDGVENPHNLGAIMRSCAHFGVSYLFGAAARLPRLSASACRVAEGGAEHVRLVFLKDPLAQLSELRAQGFTLMATSLQGESLFSAPMPDRTLMILGSELYGISPELLKITGRKVTIPGTGRVESLNVSAAFAVIAAEYGRQQP